MDLIYIVDKEQEDRLTTLVELLTEFKKDMEELNEGMDHAENETAISGTTKFEAQMRREFIL